MELKKPVSRGIPDEMRNCLNRILSCPLTEYGDEQSGFGGRFPVANEVSSGMFFPTPRDKYHCILKPDSY